MESLYARYTNVGDTSSLNTNYNIYIHTQTHTHWQGFFLDLIDAHQVPNKLKILVNSSKNKNETKAT